MSTPIRQIDFTVSAELLAIAPDPKEFLIAEISAVIGGAEGFPCCGGGDVEVVLRQKTAD